MKIVCLGDSLTYGFGVSRKDIWPNELSKLSGMEIINKGINGDTTGGMLSRFQKDVIDLKPNAVIVSGGSNDVFASQNSDAAKANIFAMLHLAASNQILMITSTLIPIDVSKTPPQWAQFADMKKSDILCGELSAWIMLFSKTFKVPILDLRQFLKDKLNANMPIYHDGLHPNKEAHKMIAVFVGKKLLEFGLKA
jgi:lysophospholipase L1-like esterase